MCGLAGILDYGRQHVDRSALIKMRDAMHSRGPDGAGLWWHDEDHIGLAHRRLAILDLSERGAQPMSSADGMHQLVFNGEVYNHPELRAWCEAKGARYRSDADTETLLHLYALEGEKFVQRLRGMFAFALWDRRNRTLILARDPFGIKPLYYWYNGRELRFASQVKALTAGGVSDTPSPAGMVSFFLWGYVTDPHCWLRDVKPVPAGSTVIVRENTAPRVEIYSDPLHGLRGDLSPAQPAVSLRDAVLDSVRHHLLADVPVGLFLSAGLDSGALCGLMTECINSDTVRGVTLGFSDYIDTPKDEVPLARVIAHHFGAPHHIVTYNRDDFEGDRDRLLAAMDQPSIDGANTFFVSKAAAAAGLKVALSGVGGDELFGGYPSFRQVPRLASMLRTVPRRFGSAFRAATAPIVARVTSPKHAGLFEYGGTVSGAYLLRRALFMPWEIGALMDPDVAAQGLEELDVLNTLDAIVRDIRQPYAQVMALEHSVYLSNCLLRDSDWAGMAHSVEIRTPLVDSTLFAQLASLGHGRMGRTYTKADWADTPARALPLTVKARAKNGFDVPIREWLMKGDEHGLRERGRRGWAKRIVRSNANSSARTAVEVELTA